MLKGVAGNIGIKTIFYPAWKLELAIRNRDDALLAMIKEFGADLDCQIQAIEQALKTFPLQPLDRQLHSRPLLCWQRWAAFVSCCSQATQMPWNPISH